MLWTGFSKAHAIGLINALFKHFSDRLKTLTPEELEQPTIFKNNLSSLGRMDILHGDQKFIQTVQQSVLAVNCDLDMAILLTISKFGQKDECKFDLSSLVDSTGVVSVSYHAACNVCSQDPTVDLFWSRCGLQEVVGSRGTLFPAYSMREMDNFQSNLDHLPLDIDQTLRQVMREGCNVGEHHRMFTNNAARYVKHIDDLARKTYARSCACLEGVFVVLPGYEEVLEPSHFFIPSMLDNLLEKIPMLIPFRDNGNGLGLCHIVQPVATLSAPACQSPHLPPI